MDFMNGTLMGNYKMKLNNENLSIPRELTRIIRNCPTPECFTTISPQRLVIYPMGSWLQYTKELKSLGTPQAKKLLQKQMMYGSKPSKIDSSGRLTLTPIHYAFMQKPLEVMIVGQGDYLEVWTIEEYRNRFENLSKDKDFVAYEDIDDTGKK